jgi:integrase
MATPKKRTNGTWGVQIDVLGVRDSSSFPTKGQATAWAQRRSTEIRTEGTGTSGTIKTLKEALREYGEKVSPVKRGHSKELIRLSAFTRQDMPLTKKLGEVTTAELVKWRDSRLALNSRGAVLRDMTLLSHVFEVARKEWQWIKSNPMKDVTRPQEPDHRERIIAGWEIRRMLRALKHGKKITSMTQAVGTAFLLALATGMRAGELCAVTWEDVKEDYLVLRTSKTGAGRHVPLSKYAQRLVKRCVGWNGDLMLGLKSQTLDSLFRRARDKAGLTGFCFHDSRPSAATKLALKLNVLDLCRVFGWKSTSQALTYYNPNATDISKRLG